MSRSIKIKSDWCILDMYWYNTVVGVILSFWSGAINGLAAITLLFERASHVSGRITDIGLYLTYMPINALLVSIIWVSFVVGSFLGGWLLPKIGLTRSLILQSLYTFVVALIVMVKMLTGTIGDFVVTRMVMAAILPLSQGFQNAITTQLPLERTTHWTGSTTDFAIALARRSWPFAFFMIAKMVAFVAGAGLAAYGIGIQGVSAHHGLFFVSGGLFLLAVVGHIVNERVKKNQPKSD